MSAQQIEFNHDYAATLRFIIGTLRAKFAETGDVTYYNQAARKLRELNRLYNSFGK